MKAPSPAEFGPSVGERIGRAILIVTIAFLTFVGGGWSVLSKTFPSDFLRNAYRASESFLAKKALSESPLRTDLWYGTRDSSRGITVYDRTEAFLGYTLFTSGDGPYARLIDMDGRVVHEWRKPFSEIWDETAAVRRPRPDSMIYMNKAHVFPNGDLLAIYTAASDTPWGYGLVKLDRNSNVIWSYLQRAHHDLDVSPDGRIFVLTHEFTSEKIEGVTDLARQRLDDFLVVLSPDGEELKKISLTRALARSRFRQFLHAFPAFAREDPLHANTANYIDSETARNLRVAQEGHVMTAFRDLGLVVAVDPESEEIVWATRGPWLGFHDPRPLPDGRILLYDNFGAFRGGRNDSRVIEFDPVTMQIAWEYTGDDDRPFFSALRGSAQRLPNGNTLVNEDQGGRVFEVNRAGRIVWEYVNPVRNTDPKSGASFIPVLTGAQRIVAERFAPEFRTAIENGKENRQ
jgi:hypothetical protein